MARSDASCAKLYEALSRRVAYQTESQNRDRNSELKRYLAEEMTASLERLGFRVTLFDNPVTGAPPFLIADRSEPGASRTVLMYGHGDVVSGDDEKWRAGLSPWSLSSEDGIWYGRGSADNKGQHSINLEAIEVVLKARGRLGLNIKFLIEMGEEVGSPGLRAFCEQHRDALAADLFLASDGPRLNASSPTVFLGSRGVANFELSIVAREGGHHSGNWGGLLKNPGTRLAHAIAVLVDAHGAILVPELKSPSLPASVKSALETIEPGEPGGPSIDIHWGEPMRSPAERVFGGNALEVLAFETGNPKKPVNAIPPRASATLQLRFVVGCDPEVIVPAIRRRLDALGFDDVAVNLTRDIPMPATRLDPDHPFVSEVMRSMTNTAGARPKLLPNLGGSLPNDCFAGTLGLPTVWIPHSYPGCNQHAPNEHLLESVARDGLALVVGVLWDLGA